MKLSWLNICFCIFFLLFASLKSKEARSLHKSFFRSAKSIKLEHFQKIRKSQEKSSEKEKLLRIWESILSGRSMIIPKDLKKKFSALSANHLFTPSGFHLSAFLFPFYKFMKGPKYKSLLIFIIFLLLFFIAPSFKAMKRMSVIKIGGQLWGHKTGFIIGMILDVLIGSFSQSTLGFTYSFIFLSIIYANKKGLHLILYFFIAQCFITYFQEKSISPLILILSPLINGYFSLILPFLIFLSYPLWDWQVFIGITLLKSGVFLLDCFTYLISYFPVVEINGISLLIIFLMMKKKLLYTLFLVALFSSGLNQPTKKITFLKKWEVQSSHDYFKKHELRVKKNKYGVSRFKFGSCRTQNYQGQAIQKCRFTKKGFP